MTRAESFHNHLDQCAQCRQHPMRLCAEGLSLLQRAMNTRTDDDVSDDLQALRAEAES